MAGVCKDEGSLFVLILKPEILTKIVTFNDLKKFLDKYRTLLSINESFSDELIRYYTRNIKMENSTDVKWRLFNMIGDLTMKCPTYLFAKRYAERSVNRSKVFFYELTHSPYEESIVRQLGVIHSSELDFVFGQPIKNQLYFGRTDVQFSRQLMTFWTNFIKYG